MKKALVSVSDKTDIIGFCKNLISNDFEIISTGGTYDILKQNNIKVRSVSDITGFKECLDGRVKTLHPNIHGGILAIRDNETHMNQMKELNIEMIDLVVVNLYPFRETILKDGVTLEEAIENIDIGGPTMLRSAAKNYEYVTVVTDPTDYSKISEELDKNKTVSKETRLYLATKVFLHTSQYDTLIANYLLKRTDIGDFPTNLTLTYEKISDMRYGENPHQKAAFYKEIGDTKGMLTEIVKLHGKELSFNNINDTHGAIELLKEFEEPTIVACKHGNPCGVGSSLNIFDAYMKAFSSDPISVFGGIIVSNREIDEKTAVEINKIFIEIILAPSFTSSAMDILTKKKNLCILTLQNINQKQKDNAFDIKKVSGGLLVQQIDNILLDDEKTKVVTNRKPTDKEMEDLLFTWKIVKYTKSNGIAIGKDKQSIGIGPGQVNRIWATNQAVEHGVNNLSSEYVKGSVLASDAFFPFSDCVEVAHNAGITAIIQPGGSIRDQESVDLCNKYNIAMVFSGVRHFRH